MGQRVSRSAAFLFHKLNSITKNRQRIVKESLKHLQRAHERSVRRKQISNKVRFPLQQSKQKSGNKKEGTAAASQGNGQPTPNTNRENLSRICSTPIKAPS